MIDLVNSLRQNYKMVSSCLIIVVSIFYLYSFTLAPLNADSFFHGRRNHECSSLQSKGLHSIATMSNGNEYEKFKNSTLAPFLITRVSDTDGNRAVQKHIIDLLKSFGWSVETDSFVDTTPLGTKTFTNIVGTFNPKVGRVLTLACHFDSKYFTNFDFIGAIDSAVPCAILLDVAQKLAPLMKKNRSDVTLQLIFFDGEEAFVTWSDTDSLYGSRHLASKWSKESFEVERELLLPRIKTIDLFVLLDLIGTADTQFQQQFSATMKHYQRLQNIESKLAANNLLEGSKRYFVSSSGGPIEDDHIPFLYNNVPVVHLISNPFPSVWHEQSDNAANLDHKTINNINKIIRVFVAEYLRLVPSNI